MESVIKCVKNFIERPGNASEENLSLFEDVALKVFSHQYSNCEPYKRYINYIGTDTESIKSIEDIPFLPVQFFKSEEIYCGPGKPEKIFTSSATTVM